MSFLAEILKESKKHTVLLVEILAALDPGPAVRVIFTANLEGKITEDVKQMKMTSSQQVSLSVKFVDKRGNPAPVDGVPEWGSSNTDVVTLTVSEDGLSAVAVAVGPLGSATVSVQADADMGSGTTPVAGSLDIDITAGSAVTVSITAGTPEDQPV